MRLEVFCSEDAVNSYVWKDSQSSRSQLLCGQLDLLEVPQRCSTSSKMLIRLYPQLSTYQAELKNPLGWEATCLGDLQVSWTTVQLWFWLKGKSGDLQGLTGRSKNGEIHWAPTNSMTLQFDAPRRGLQDPLRLPQPEVVGWLTALMCVPSYKTSTPLEKEGPLCRHPMGLFQDI